MTVHYRKRLNSIPPIFHASTSLMYEIYAWKKVWITIQAFTVYTIVHKIIFKNFKNQCSFFYRFLEFYNLTCDVILWLKCLTMLIQDDPAVDFFFVSWLNSNCEFLYQVSVFWNAFHDSIQLDCQSYNMPTNKFSIETYTQPKCILM